MKRLAIFLDGTWNDPGDNTNVWRLRSMLAKVDVQNNEQLAYYDTGVGTGWFDRFRGGATGVGLSENVREAYAWLIENYDDGDAIYLFGFSRGAFTARSLAGMISKCGLLRPGSPMPVQQVYDRYWCNDARPIYRLPRSVSEDSDLELEDRWIVEYSRRIRVHFIGVWDTVGALGINLLPGRREQRGEYHRHFVRLSASFDHACQAMAIDEHRKPYPISRWYHFVPEGVPDMQHSPPPEVEQRWFVGAHSNVGGGYRNDALAQLPLEWMQKKAAATGLTFRYSPVMTGDEHLAQPVDSFAKFFKGVYRIAKFGRRSYRTIGEPRTEVEGGWIEPHFETIDASVFLKWQQDGEYRPKNLAAWAERAGVDLDAVADTQPTRRAGDDQ